MLADELPDDWKRSSIQFMIPFRPGRQTNYTAYNVNYYPSYVESLLNRAIDLHGQTLAFALSYSEQLSFDAAQFRAELCRTLSHDRFLKYGHDPRADYLAVCQLGSSTTTFFSFVASVKALLDVMASVWMKVADNSKRPKVFSKGRVSGDLLAGGDLIKWFRGSSCPEKFAARQDAAEVLEKNSRDWITELVGYRDDFMHHGGIRDLTPLSVVLDSDYVVEGDYRPRIRPEYSSDEFVLPTLPTGQLVPAFIADVSNKLQAMMREMAKLFTLDEPRSPPGPPKPGDRFYFELLD